MVLMGNMEVFRETDREAERQRDGLVLHLMGNMALFTSALMPSPL